MLFLTKVLDLILCWEMRNYRRVILLNLKMFLCASWPIFLLSQKTHYYSKLFQKLSVFKTECSNSEIWNCQWHKTCSIIQVFTTLIFLLIFQIIKIGQCCGFTLFNFFFFLTATNVTSWVTFSNTRIIVFFLFFDLIFPWYLDVNKLYTCVF